LGKGGVHVSDDKAYKEAYEEGVKYGVEEGIAIERIRVLNLIDEYVGDLDMDLETLIECIEDV
jgi:hypothetical protein